MTALDERLIARRDRIEQVCELMVRLAREQDLSVRDGEIAAMALGAVMMAVQYGAGDAAQLSTMLREIIERELENGGRQSSCLGRRKSQGQTQDVSTSLRSAQYDADKGGVQ